MSTRLGQAICWIASLLTLSVGVLALAASITALAVFAFGVHHLVSTLGIANWSSLGVGALFVALIGSIWLMGNSFLDVIAASGSRRYATKRSRRTQIILPLLLMAAAIGSLFYLFGA
jgi:hypothetical protein